jgi:hypothetical protein
MPTRHVRRTVRTGLPMQRSNLPLVVWFEHGRPGHPALPIFPAVTSSISTAATDGRAVSHAWHRSCFPRSDVFLAHQERRAGGNECAAPNCGSAANVCSSCNYGNMQGVSRMGRNAGGIYSFTCSSCGEIAATIELVDGSLPLNVGSGPHHEDMVITFGPELRMRLTWLGVSSGPVSAEVAQLLASDEELDPLVLSGHDWELGAFCCRQCSRNYCSKCWRARPIFADDYPGWHEETRGTCPEGHDQRLED